MSGISTTQTELALIERKKVLSELIPYPILVDFKNIEFDLIRLNLIKKNIITEKIYNITQLLLILLSRVINKMMILFNK